MKLLQKDLEFRKLKKTDFKEFSKLFYLCFKKRISLHFFKWRYFNDKYSFCYGVFFEKKLIANVGIKSMILNNKNKELAISRHSSMVLKKFRGLRIFSELLTKVKNKEIKKIKIIVMWPNNNNLASFGISNSQIVKRKLYLYKTLTVKKKIITQTKDQKIEDLKNYRSIINSNNNFFYKDIRYYIQKYLSYKKNEYFLNKFQSKNLTSLYVIKKNKEDSKLNYVILDHFGSTKIKSLHLKNLINEKRKLIFCSKSRINKLNYKLLNHINLNIGFTKKYDFIKRKNFAKKDFMLGDTDSFLTIN